MMTPDGALALVAQVKQSGEWEVQQHEEWQAVWKLQAITISRDDPYKVQLLGQQEITKTINGVAQHDSRQLIFTLALRSDTAGRTEDNLNTGFRVAGIAEMKVLLNQESNVDKAAVNSAAISVASPKPAQ
jgi:hypothetical protein